MSEYNKKISKDTQLKIFDMYCSLNTPYSTLFYNHPDLVFTLDLKGMVISYNNHAFKLLGYTAEEIQNTSYHKYVVPNDFDKVTTFFHRSSNGETICYDTKLIHKSGTELDVSVTNIPIYNENQVIGVYGIVKDLSELKLKESSLRKMHDNLNEAQKVANIGSWDYDVIEDEAFWSNQMYEIFGIKKASEFVPTLQKVIELVHPKDQEYFEETIIKSKKTKKDYSIKYRIVQPSGKVRTVYEEGNIILDDNLQPIRIIGISHDITERVQAEKQLLEKEKQVNQIYDNLDVCIWSKDIIEDKILFLSNGITDITGFSPSEIDRNFFSWENLILKEDLHIFHKMNKKLLEGNPIKHEYRIRDKNGNVRWVRDHTIPILDEEKKIIRLDGIISDITEQKAAEEKMYFLAYHDSLTHLPKRRKFNLDLTQLIKECEKDHSEFAILYINLDRFKFINDSLGFQVGDRLLIEISNRLKQHIQDEALLYRVHGDEFAIIFNKYSNDKDIYNMAEQINHLIKQTYVINNYDIYITASIGICIYPHDGTSVDQLIRNLNQTLYKAKSLGKDNYQIYSEMIKSTPSKKLLLENDVRQAITNNEFIMYYQPRLDVKQKKIVSAEALIRWNHPVLGIVPPGEFIPFAEESGLIIEIGNWVVRKVCSQLKEWINQSIDIVPISINISPKSFLKREWFNKVKTILEEEQIDPSLIEFEITESIVMQNEKVVFDVIENLKELGIKLSLDDFGTGYSSITYLKNIKFDYIKIDRSFIQNIEQDKQNRMITKGIIELSHNLDIEIVAEGIETEEQFKLIEEMGGNQVQGYLFSKPLSPKEFIEFFTMNKF